MTDERYAVVELCTTSASKEHYDDEGNLVEVTLPVADGPFDHLDNAEHSAAVSERDYTVVSITPGQDDE